MTQDEFIALSDGDIVRSKGTGDAYVVIGELHTKDRIFVTAVRQVIMTNPSEWDLARKTTTYTQTESEAS
jgi:hypothetical protein